VLDGREKENPNAHAKHRKRTIIAFRRAKASSTFGLCQIRFFVAPSFLFNLEVSRIGCHRADWNKKNRGERKGIFSIELLMYGNRWLDEPASSIQPTCDPDSSENGTE
jgi:hypothetical protein